MYVTSWITDIILIHIIIIMPSELEKFKQYLYLYPFNKQIIFINRQIDSLENIKIRTGSKDRVNRKYSTIKYLNH